MNEIVEQLDRTEPALGRGTMVQDECKKEYRPSRSECLREYQINIRFLSIGCVIEVGCKSIPFSTVKEGMKVLNDYVANPYETKKIWEERFSKEEEL
jgi:hypothetical protein